MYGVIKATFTDNQILKLSTGYHQLHLIKHKTSTWHLTLIKIHKKKPLTSSRYAMLINKLSSQKTLSEGKSKLGSYVISYM